MYRRRAQRTHGSGSDDDDDDDHVKERRHSIHLEDDDDDDDDDVPVHRAYKHAVPPVYDSDEDDDDDGIETAKANLVKEAVRAADKAADKAAKDDAVNRAAKDGDKSKSKTAVHSSSEDEEYPVTKREAAHTTRKLAKSVEESVHFLEKKLIPGVKKELETRIEGVERDVAHANVESRLEATTTKNAIAAIERRASKDADAATARLNAMVHNITRLEYNTFQSQENQKRIVQTCEQLSQQVDQDRKVLLDELKAVKHLLSNHQSVVEKLLRKDHALHEDAADIPDKSRKAMQEMQDNLRALQKQAAAAVPGATAELRGLLANITSGIQNRLQQIRIPDFSDPKPPADTKPDTGTKPNTRAADAKNNNNKAADASTQKKRKEPEERVLTYNDARKLLKSMGISANGTWEDLEQRLLSLDPPIRVVRAPTKNKTTGGYFPYGEEPDFPYGEEDEEDPLRYLEQIEPHAHHHDFVLAHDAAFVEPEPNFIMPLVDPAALEGEIHRVVYGAVMCLVPAENTPPLTDTEITEIVSLLISFIPLPYPAEGVPDRQAKVLRIAGVMYACAADIGRRVGSAEAVYTTPPLVDEVVQTVCAQLRIPLPYGTLLAFQ